MDPHPPTHLSLRGFGRHPPLPYPPTPTHPPTYPCVVLADIPLPQPRPRLRSRTQMSASTSTSSWTRTLSVTLRLSLTKTTKRRARRALGGSKRTFSFAHRRPCLPPRRAAPFSHRIPRARGPDRTGLRSQVSEKRTAAAQAPSFPFGTGAIHLSHAVSFWRGIIR